MSEPTDHTQSPSMDAGACPNGHLSYPAHPNCPECGEPQGKTVDLSDRTAEVVTWTESTATPPGVRRPNELVIVEFDVDGEPVRAIGQVAEDTSLAVGDEVRPVSVEELRDPVASMREPESQEWGGFQFEPV
jgi:uncharacterized OB-fold protein